MIRRFLGHITAVVIGFMLFIGLNPAIPIEVLFSQPTYSRVRISPSGRYISYCAPENGVPELFVQDRETKAVRQLTSGHVRPFGGYFWRYDEKGILFVDDAQGDENWHIKSIDRETGAVVDLTPYEGVQVRILSYVKSKPSTLLVSINKDDHSSFDVYEFDLDTHLSRLIFKNDGTVQSFLIDTQGLLRGFTSVNQETGAEEVHIGRDQISKRLLLSWDMDESLNSHVIKFSAQGDSLFAYDSRGVDKTQLVKIDIVTGHREILAASDDAEIASAFFDFDTDDIWAIALSRDDNNFFILRDEYQKHFEYFKDLHEGDPLIVSASNDRRWWIICFVPEDASPAYYLYDSVMQRAEHFCDSKPILNEYKYGKVQPISFTARDGLTITGYLTQPYGITSPSALPLILLVHGGPWARDSRGFDSEVQFLASRGYAVLQVNFRGSVGFGKAFTAAGDKQWGRAMQNDLTDAVAWAVDLGIADPSRVAIMGASYGGYAALAGASFTPDLYRCAIDLCGPSNLISFLSSIPPYWKIFHLVNDKRIGHSIHDRDDLVQRSPLFFVDQIKIPLLIAQGAHDPRVVKAESDQMVDALIKHEIPVDYLIFEDEGHGLAKAENRYLYYQAVEKFLARYL
jgi:dipeptidyl aminopeptidase/acylaminoacyl peptidase